jgi:MFS family permease
VVLLVGQAMASMDASILVVAAPSLRSSLHASGAELQLILATYTLTFGALVVSGARLGDVLGKRRAFVVGLAAFTICSLAGGLAPDPGPLIVARAFQGAAAALMTPQVLSIIQVQFDGERRARAIGAYSMILAVGVAAGQILGGLLVTAHLAAAAWRPALLVNAPIGAPLLLASRRVLPPMAPAGKRRLDLIGACLLAAAMLALVATQLWACLRLAGVELAVLRRLRGRGLLVPRARASLPPARRRPSARPRASAGAESGVRCDRRAARHELLRGFSRELDPSSTSRSRLHAPGCRCDFRDLRRRLRHCESHLDARG